MKPERGFRHRRELWPHFPDCSARDISLEDEKTRIKTIYESRFDRMRLLPKSAAATVWNGPDSTDPPSDIDRVLAASQVRVQAASRRRRRSRSSAGPRIHGRRENRWIATYSDHAMIRFTVTGVG
jgi:hypothetical protein